MAVGDPFHDPRVEVALSKGIRAINDNVVQPVGNAVKTGANAIASVPGQVADSFRRGQSQMPNYQMIAPSKGGESKIGNFVNENFGGYNGPADYFERYIDGAKTGFNAINDLAKQGGQAVVEGYAGFNTPTFNTPSGAGQQSQVRAGQGGTLPALNSDAYNTQPLNDGFIVESGAKKGQTFSASNPAFRMPGRLGDSEVNPATGRNAMQEFRLANQIRREGIDQQVAREQANFASTRTKIANAIANSGGDPYAEQRKELERAYRSAASTRSLPARALAVSRIKNLQKQLTDQQGSDDTRRGQDVQLERAGIAADAESGYRAALADKARVEADLAPARLAASVGASPLLDADTYDMFAPRGEDGLEAPLEFDEEGNPIFLRDLLIAQENQRLRNASTAMGQANSYAEGGLVSSQPQAMPTTGAGQVARPQMAAIQNYQQYADAARGMGLSVVPFNDFLNLQGGEGRGVVGMAEGGVVPGGDSDVSGKMVIDPDPNAPTDSIPAQIDGHQPAALDSGEFVIPKDVVMFYGTDKLKKMIEKAREPDGGDQQRQNAIQSVTAGQQPAV